ncbi:hypothetical protein LCGC14_1696650 [marine sediment metagenome]|uniref:Uncharacterized protein n=1 Tax=marine sediment metagenome TaxID=412755 RepID=A0A0F9I6T9_9ZZZZ
MIESFLTSSVVGWIAVVILSVVLLRLARVPK